MAVNDAAWWSQRVAAEGSTASEGIRRQLGKPQLDPLTVLIREAAQNSCDAALPGDGDVDFNVQIRRLTGNRLANWTKFLLPEPAGSALGIEQALAGESRILTISDRGTTGLGGPLRADEPTRAGERADFVKFIRNVGERKGVDLGGGSYGFGKGILYNVSRCHIVVADSQCVFRGRLQRRLIGAAMGDGYEHGGVRFTGRHWLGVQDGDIAQALIGEEAEKLADQLGLPKFAQGQTGTTVAIVDADLGVTRTKSTEKPRTPEDAAEYLASTILWNLWPRMIEGAHNRLRCSVKFEGFAVDIPAPESTIELKPFVDAYRKLSRPNEYEVPVRKKAPTEVGRFAKVESMAPLKPHALLSKAAPFEGGARHCARMRQADLVVNYVQGEPHPDEAIQYAGVFRSSVDADGYFADAEPPTHDDWVTNGLHGVALGVVQLAARFVRTNMTVAPPEIDSSAQHDAALAPLAGRLSGLVSGTKGDGAELRRGGAGRRSRHGGSGRSSANPKIIEGPALRQESGQAVIVAKVQFPTWPTKKSVVANPVVVIEGGVEPPGVLEPPTVLRWECTETGEVRSGSRVALLRNDKRIWEVTVLPPGDAVIRLGVTVESDD
ncbi:hypothetical protein DFR67_103455 [Williamsia limnetica]|uniref:Uncharacterized protein n=1 Tax=Williamsia limnetica TaxID=882452 RepID=A0A318RMJ9_WILLI|nr:hypothetical protein [Williamsia limnetica]PYE19542.1 hypothetical protein DFR67_103455 [Williamsia limnetica]